MEDGDGEQECGRDFHSFAIPLPFHIAAPLLAAFSGAGEQLNCVRLASSATLSHQHLLLMLAAAAAVLV